MDVSSGIRNSKNQKLNEEHDTDGSSNSIGNFPDTILQHILSLLPTKDAVGTSILSKRWQYLWMSIRNLDFQQGLPAKRMLFMNFVERVLVHRDSSNVEKFSLTCDVLNDASRIDAWISAAVRRKVQELYICLRNFEEPFVLPHRLFTCDSLTMLEVQMRCILKLPLSICFSSLKILTLNYVTFSDDYSFQQLFSGCTVLEELCIDGCNWENLEAVSICAPKLWSLTINETNRFGTSVSNGCQVMIFGTSLKSFSYTGELINDYFLYNSSSLVEACFYVAGWFKRARLVAYRANKLLIGLYNVNDLILSTDVVDVLNYATELIAFLPMFNNLTNLEFDADCMCFDRALTLYVLQSCPCVKSIVFAEGIGFVSTGVGWILDPVPPFFSSHLKSIEVGNLIGSDDELFLIESFLKNATVLDRMVITCSRDFAWELEKKKKVHEQLLKLPRASASCSIEFY